MSSTAVALGNFDGVHKGHQMLIRECVAVAKEKGLQPSVFTFTNHPVNEIAGKTVIKNIMTFEEKAEQLEKLGVENLFSPVFEEDLYADIDLKNCLAKRESCGGPGPQSVKKQIKELENELKKY